MVEVEWFLMGTYDGGAGSAFWVGAVIEQEVEFRMESGDLFSEIVLFDVEWRGHD